MSGPATIISDEERGGLVVAERAVAKIAAQVVAEVEHVGGATRRVLGVPFGAGDDQGRLARVSATVRGEVAALDVELSVVYPAPVRRVTEGVREQLVARVGELTGLLVRQVDIAVTRLTPPAAARRSLR